MNSAVLDLNEAERARILAKAAAFAPPPATLPDGRRDLVGLSREELAAEMVALGEKPFRAKQLWHWIYHQGETDFARMNTIAKPMQMKLAERFVVGRPEVATQQDSADGTRKWLFRFRDQQQPREGFGAPEGDAAPGLPAFITSPSRVSDEQPSTPDVEQQHQDVEAGGYHLRPRRRRRPRDEEGADAPSTEGGAE